MYQQLELDFLLEKEPIVHTKDAQKVVKDDGEAIVYHNFFSFAESDHFYRKLEQQTNWKQDHIKMYGRQIPLPRLTAWYGDEGKSYTYSGIEQHPDPWTPTLQSIKSRVEAVAEVRFNSVLLNFYRSGKDSVSWHSDDEPELGKNSVIASVSFGGTRRFSLKHKDRTNFKVNIELSHGSLLLMKDEMQHHWLHQIPKRKQAVNPRINLTFRIIQ